MRKVAGLAASWLLLVLGPCRIAAGKSAEWEVLEDDRNQRYRYRLQSVLLPEKDFGWERLLAIAKSFVSANRSLLYARLHVVTQRGDVPIQGFLATHIGHSVYTWLAEGARKENWLVGEVLMIRGNAILRVRLRDGQVRTTVLRGRDPLRLEVDGIRIQVEWIGHWSDSIEPPFERPFHSVTIFATTAAHLDSGTAKSVFRKLEPLLPYRVLQLEIAPIPWFPYADQFPLVFPFGLDFPLPTDQEYDDAQRITCVGVGASGTGPQCTNMKGQWRESLIRERESRRSRRTGNNPGGDDGSRRGKPSFRIARPRRRCPAVRPNTRTPGLT